jgi:hypothetical protein
MRSLNEILADTPGLLVNGDWVCLNIDSGALISRVDAYLPVNMMANLDGHIAELAAWDKFIADREQPGAANE